jgi:L-lactate utilization protein LutB
MTKETNVTNLEALSERIRQRRQAVEDRGGTFYQGIKKKAKNIINKIKIK